MKKYIFLFSILLLAGGREAFAQKEFSIALSSSELEIKPGESREVTVNITRSRGYNKAKAKLGVSSTLPKGITVTYQPADGLIQESVARITVAPETPAGTYTIIPNCTMNYISKGATLKLTVPGSPVSKSGQP